MGKIKVYSRNKYIGVDANDLDIPNLKLLNMLQTAKVDKDNFVITPEAYKLLFKTQKGDQDDIGEIQCFKARGKVIFGWLGMSLALFDSDHLMGSSNFDFELLKDFISEDVQIPESFVEMCNMLIQRDLDEQEY